MRRPVRRAPRRRRPGRTASLAAPVAVLVGLASAGCSTEPVTPTASPVAYATIGSGIANPGSTVAVVDATTGKLGRPVTVGTLPAALALLPGDKDLVVAVKAQNELVEVSTATGKVVHRVTVGLEPDAVAVTPDGSRALVANFGDGTVTSVTLATFAVGATVPVGRQPVAIAVTPAGTRALVANYQDGTVTPVALPGLSPGAPVAVGPEPSAVFIASDGGTALVAGFQTSTVTPIALPGLTPAPPVPIGANPTGIAGAPGSPVAWVSGGDGITPMGIVSRQVGASVSIGAPAEALAVSAGGQIWVCSGNGALVEIDPSTGRVVRTISLDGIPSAVVITRAAGA